MAIESSVNIMRYTTKVKPGSTKGPLVVTEADGLLTVYLRERAADGKANEALIKLLSKHFGVPKTKLQIIRGHTSRTKIIEIA